MNRLIGINSTARAHRTHRRQHFIPQTSSVEPRHRYRSVSSGSVGEMRRPRRRFAIEYCWYAVSNIEKQIWPSATRQGRQRNPLPLLQSADGTPNLSSRACTSKRDLARRSKVYRQPMDTISKPRMASIPRYAGSQTGEFARNAGSPDSGSRRTF